MGDWRTTDLCDEHGTRLRVPLPGLRHFGGNTRFCGPVSTLRCFEDNSRVREAVAEPGHGRVLVIDGGGSLACALFGDLLGAKALGNGWAGVIIDGCIRDSVVLGELPLGVLARAAVPRRSEKRGLGDRDVALRMSGVEVRPGDYVYADEDGWIVSEQALA